MGWTEPSRSSVLQHIGPQTNLGSQDWQRGAIQERPGPWKWSRPLNQPWGSCCTFLRGEWFWMCGHSCWTRPQRPLIPVTLWRKGQRPREGMVLPCDTAGQPRIQDPGTKHSRWSACDMSMKLLGCSQQTAWLHHTLI